MTVAYALGKTSAPGLGCLAERLVRPISLARDRRSPNDLLTEILEPMCEPVPDGALVELLEALEGAR